MAAALLFTGYRVYNRIFRPNTGYTGDTFVHIPTGAGFDQVAGLLATQGLLNDTSSFRWVAERMNYTDRVLPGRYRVSPGMNNKELVALLRSGRQEPVRLVLNSVRIREQLAGRVSAVLEADSAELLRLLRDNGYLEAFGFDTLNCLSMFVPNTYEFYWNTGPGEFINRMNREYQAFWTADRQTQAARADLSVHEVSVLASIVEQETRKADEKPMIAGVYINRYRKGWKLEADPTLVFALGDFSIRRVLHKYKEIDSPFNTYMYAGLPPGPICIPSISSIDAVLNYADHKYMYFCARDDFSGYHVFARTYSEHLANARRFQRELNRRNINS